VRGLPVGNGARRSMNEGKLVLLVEELVLRE
jgi:hypothetical protein